MATSRVVNTNFWRDTYVIDLDPTQKLLFLYFLTNPNTTLAGVYEISLRQAAFDTGIDRDMIEKILDKFMADGKMYYENGWLVLNNFIKHQRLNPSIIRGIEKALEDLPDWLRAKIAVDKPETQQMSIFVPVKQQSADSLSTDSPQYNLIKSNIKKLKEKKPKPDEPADGSNDPEAQKPQAKFDKKAYAKAVRADEQLAEKEHQAMTRPKSGSGYASARETIEQIKQRTQK